MTVSHRRHLARTLLEGTSLKHGKCEKCIRLTIQLHSSLFATVEKRSSPVLDKQVSDSKYCYMFETTPAHSYLLISMLNDKHGPIGKALQGNSSNFCLYLNVS